MRILAIDYGEKHIGIAISDPTQTLASGLTTLEHSEDILEKICDLVKEYSATTIVVGIPYNMNFTKGPSAEKAEAFIELLKGKLDIPIETQDERLTSAMGERMLIEAGTSRNKRKKVIDKISAQLILQSYLDMLKLRNNSEEEDTDV